MKMARGSLLIGRYKAHWVLRGDHQTFDEPGLDDEDEEDESDDAASDDYKAEDTHGFATTPRSTDPPRFRSTW